jgi:D-alanine-D-alanine ligase
VFEVNTIPGFTETSLVPMAAAAEGKDFPTLCGDIVHMALERFWTTKPM